VIYWRLTSGVLLTSIDPAEKALIDVAHSYQSNGGSAATVVCRQYVPAGAADWARSEKGPWHPVTTATTFPPREETPK